MIPIPSEFKGNRDQSGPAGAYHFKLLKRQGQVALFEKSNPDHPTKPIAVLYEVVILKTVPEKRWPDGRVTPAHESMPSPEEWGLYGWSPATYERAVEIFNREAGNMVISLK
jgi:hypothetical protein